MTPSAFKKIIWAYYKKNRRDFPWRVMPGKTLSASGLSPYHIFVSEIMLQQTQAPRVVEKFKSFIQKFPTFNALAGASLNDVLKEWHGLGYNRRGLNLKKAAEVIITKHNGKIPKAPEALLELPGIGPGTVGSLLAFVHNIPHPFIETNIRTVFIHFFFTNKKDIDDKTLLPLVEKTLDHNNPREWYYALMDYGVMLKKTHQNPSRKSAHYTKQSTFKGSNRELRSKILSFVMNNPGASLQKISRSIEHALLVHNDTILKANITDLKKEGFITEKKDAFFIAE